MYVVTAKLAGRKWWRWWMVEVGGHGVNEDGVGEDRSTEVIVVEGVVRFGGDEARR